MISRGAIHDFVVSHHPKNTAGAIHSAGLAVQAGNNLGNSHLQVSGGWQHGGAPPGNEGRDEKEHGSQISLMHAALGDWPCRKGRVYSMPRSRAVGPCFAVMSVFLLEE